MILLLILILSIAWGFIFEVGEGRRQYFATLLSTILFYVILGIIIYIIYLAYSTIPSKHGINILVALYIFWTICLIEIFINEKYHFWQKEFWNDKNKDMVLRGRELKYSDVFIMIGLVFFLLSLGDTSLDMTLYRLELSLIEFVHFLIFEIIF
jgi:hypothetical protein